MRVDDDPLIDCRVLKYRVVYVCSDHPEATSAQIAERCAELSWIFTPLSAAGPKIEDRH